MTKDKALKMAIEVCKEALESQDEFGKAYMEGFNAGKMFAELQSQEQKPVDMRPAVYGAWKEQEPVAFADDIEEMIQRLQNWCEAYPTDIFPEISKEELDYINAQNKNLSGKFFAHVGRHFIAKGLKPALDLFLRIYTHPHQWQGDKDEK